MPIYNQIINQKGTPAFYSDIFANRPAFGYAGRVFISTDTGAIYEDTGSAWTLIADAGAGTTGTLQQVTTNGNTTTLGVTIQGLTIGKGAGTIASNTAIGNLALNSNTTGSGITAIGSSALQSNTTGQNNIGVGANSLFANTTGGNNTGLGANTLIANTTASFNTAIGSLAMSLNSTGSNNTAVGYNSLLNNTIGVDNTAIGTNALLSNSNGGSNTAIGMGTLFTNSTGANNTAIGKNALNNNTTASNNIAIGNNSLSANTTASFNTAVGTTSMQLNTTGANNTALGYQSLNANTTGANNTAIGLSALSGNTTASFNTAIGSSSLLNNTTGGNNVAIGYESLKANTTANNNTAVGNVSLTSNTTGTSNTGVGAQSLNQNTTGSTNTAIGTASMTLNTTGASNTAIGSSALQNNTTASNNVAIGTNSLLNNTTGQFNTAIGSSSLQSNTTSANNTAVGYSALQINTTGTNNTAIGLNSLQNNTTGTGNTAVGVSTLTTNTTGFQNSALGISALQNNTTGNYNTGIGNNALNLNTTGQLNTTIGYNSGSAITTGSNNTIIGAYAGTTTLASHIVLSDGAGNVRLFSDANGLIGINQAVGSTIGGQLDIHTTQTYALVLNGLSTSNAYTAFSNASVGKWRIGNTYNAGANSFDIFNLGTSSNAISINATNNVGIGTSPDLTLTVNGAMNLRNSTRAGAFEIDSSGNLWMGTATTLGDIYFETGHSTTGLPSTGTARMTITGAGNILINGGTDNGKKLQVLGGSGTAYFGGLVYWKCTSQASATVTGLSIDGSNSGNASSADTTGSYNHFLYYNANGLLGYITTNGVVTTYNSVSDYRYKQDLQDFNGLNLINKIKTYDFEWKIDKSRNYGVIAHELQEILPYAVNGIKDGKQMQGVDYSKIVPILVKAIQELNEKLERNNIN